MQLRFASYSPPRSALAHRRRCREALPVTGPGGLPAAAWRGECRSPRTADRACCGQAQKRRIQTAWQGSCRMRPVPAGALTGNLDSHHLRLPAAYPLAPLPVATHPADAGANCVAGRAAPPAAAGCAEAGGQQRLSLPAHTHHGGTTGALAPERRPTASALQQRGCMLTSGGQVSRSCGGGLETRRDAAVTPMQQLLWERSPPMPEKKKIKKKKN